MRKRHGASDLVNQTRGVDLPPKTGTGSEGRASAELQLPSKRQLAEARP